MVEVIKLFIIWHKNKNKEKKAKATTAEVIPLYPVVCMQASNQPMGITGE